MDPELRRLHRHALADPTDGARRAAYGRALQQNGRRVAAAHELTAALLLGGEHASSRIRIEAPHQPGGPTLDWVVDLQGVDPAVVASPAVPDTRWPHAKLEPLGAERRRMPLVLVPFPACSACPGSEPCDECGGVVMDDEDEDACPTCGGTGQVPIDCAVCHGSGLEPRSTVAGPCAHEGLSTASIEHHEDPWAMARCPTCGLAALRRVRDDGATDRLLLDGSEVEPAFFPACPACGLLACDGDCAAVSW